MHEDGPDDRALRELASRRRKVALLLYLARQSRPASRELLATLLWAEEAPDRARHNLTEALSHIRRALGREALAARSQDVSLQMDASIAFDVREFEHACALGDHETARALYTGPFLAGVFLDRAPAFDDWASRERVRLHALFVDVSARALAQYAAASDDTRSIAVCEQWLSEDLESTPAAVALLEAMARPDTREACRAVLDRFEQLRTRLAAELESEPEPPVRVVARRAAERLAELAVLARGEVAAQGLAPSSGAASRLAANGSANDALPSTTPPVAPALLPDGTPELVSAAMPWAAIPAPESTVHASSAHASTAPASTAHAAALSSSRARVRSRWLMSVGALVAVVAAGAVLRQARSANTPTTRLRVLVADTQDPARDPIMSASMTLALGVALAQSEQFDVISRERVRDALQLMRRPDSTALDERTAIDVALRLGVAQVIMPALARFGTERSLSARVIDVGTGRTLAVEQSAAAGEDALLPALDALATKLLLRLGDVPSAARARRPLPDLTTASLGALQAYVAAGGYVARAQYDSAYVTYQRALLLDSAFSSARAAFGELLHTLNRPADGERELTLALSRRDRLSAREAMRIEALQARWRRQSDSAIAIQERWLAAYPFDTDTRSALAFDLLADRRFAESRDAYVRLLATDSMDTRDWINLANAAGGMDTPTDLTLARKAYARAVALNPALQTDVVQNNQYGSLLVRAGFPDSAVALFRRMLGKSPSSSARGYRSLGLLALWRDDPRTAAIAFDSAARLHQSLKEPLSEVRARLLLASARMDLGDTSGARAQLETVRGLSRVGVAEPIVLYWAGKAMVRQGMLAAGRELLDTLRRRAVPQNIRHESAVLLLAGEVDVAAGRARSALASMQRAVAMDSTDITRESLAHALLAAGDTSRAMLVYRALSEKPRFGWEGTLAQQTAARQLRQLAR